MQLAGYRAWAGKDECSWQGVGQGQVGLCAAVRVKGSGRLSCLQAKA